MRRAAFCAGGPATEARGGACKCCATGRQGAFLACFFFEMPLLGVTGGGAGDAEPGGRENKEEEGRAAAVAETAASRACRLCGTGDDGPDCGGMGGRRAHAVTIRK